MKNKRLKNIKLKLFALKERLGLPRSLRPLAAVTVAVALLVKGALLIQAQQNKNYDLIILAATPMGYSPIGRLVVTNVSHENDGSLCFKNLSDEKRMCLKFDAYDLTEAEVR